MSEDDKRTQKIVYLKKSEVLELFNNPDNRKELEAKVGGGSTATPQISRVRAGARYLRQSHVQTRSMVDKQHDTMTAVFKGQSSTLYLLYDFLIGVGTPVNDLIALAKSIRGKSFWERHWVSILGLAVFTVLFLTLGFSPNALSAATSILSNFFAQIVIAAFAILVVVIAIRKLVKGKREEPSVLF